MEDLKNEVLQPKATISKLMDFIDMSNYDKIYFKEKSIHDQFFSMFLHPLVPFTLVTMYWFLSKPVCRVIREAFKISPNGFLLKCLTITHSTLLAVYSAWTFHGSMKLILPHMTVHYTQSIASGFFKTLCAVRSDDGKYSSQLWENYYTFNPHTNQINEEINMGLGFWITHFYISKYCEFMDTWLVMLKGKDPIFLQVYHHAG